jgi:lia operon protein LiaG
MAPASSVDSIEIRTVSTDVKWHETNGSEIKAHLNGYATSETPELVFNNAGGDLQIEVRYRPTLHFGNGFSRVALDVYVPKKEWKRIVLRTTSGDVTLPSIVADEFSFETVSGEFTAEGLAARTARVVSTSGELRAAGLQGDLEARSVSGDLDFAYAKSAGQVKLGSTSGDVRLDLPTDASFTLQAESVSGDISCDFPVTISGTGVQRHLSGTVAGGRQPVRINTTSGEIRVY